MIQPYVGLNHVSSMIESWHTHDRVTMHMWLSHVPPMSRHVIESHNTYGSTHPTTRQRLRWWVSMSHVPHMNESCHTHDQVMPHIWLGFVTRMSRHARRQRSAHSDCGRLWLRVNVEHSDCGGNYMSYIYIVGHIVCATYSYVVGHMVCMTHYTSIWPTITVGHRDCGWNYVSYCHIVGRIVCETYSYVVGHMVDTWVRHMTFSYVVGHTVCEVSLWDI